MVDEVESKETQITLWAALGLLMADDRDIVTMRYYLGLSEEEMSAVLECPRGTVKSRIHSALTRLRAIIERDHPGLAPGPAKGELE